MLLVATFFKIRASICNLILCAVCGYIKMKKGSKQMEYMWPKYMEKVQNIFSLSF
jgi:hypothetical protein